MGSPFSACGVEATSPSHAATIASHPAFEIASVLSAWRLMLVCPLLRA